MKPLDPQRFAEVESLFHELVELDFRDRESRLIELAAADPELASELRELLRAETEHQEAVAGLELLVRGEEGTRSATLALSRADESTNQPPAHASEDQAGPAEPVLGAYRLIRRLGRGGMGEVWEAEQTEPIERRVAVKLVGRQRPDPRVVARFLAERQALATMDHPHIARVFDAGQTERGVPYLVMELVQDAEPLTLYAERRELDLEARLELFAATCDAIEHAHRKRVIHRDLKPSNVLVSEIDGRASVKVIDFGIAKPLAEEELLATTGAVRAHLTRQGDLIGTPRYMSPEQAALGAVDVDTRSDVYTLGLILYELLVGELPLRDDEVHTLPFDELLRRIREQDPPRASTRLRERVERTSGETETRRSESAPSSAHGPTPPTPPREPSEERSRTAVEHQSTLSTAITTSWRRLRGDLDRIVAKALDRDRDRRYGTAGELADDVRRFLRAEPVLATDPSFAYQSAKFFLRHRFAVSFALMAAAGVLASLIGTSFGLVRARAAEQRALGAERDARTEARTAEQVARFLDQMLREANPEQAEGATSVRDLLERGEKKLRDELQDEPAVRARLLLTVGNAFRASGELQKAEELFDEAQSVATEAHGNVSPQVERVLAARSDLLHYTGRSQEAYDVALQGLAIADQVYEEQSPEYGNTLLQVAMVDWRLGRFDAAFERLEESLTILRAVSADQSPDGSPQDEATRERAIDLMPRVLNNVAILHWQQGRMPEAGEAYQEALEILQRIRPADHPHTASTLNNLALVQKSLGEFEDARDTNLEALRIRRSRFEAPHPDIAESLNNLGMVLVDLRERQRARETLEEALAMRRELFEPPNDLIATTQYNLGRMLAKPEPDPAARRLLLDALTAFEETLGPDHLYVSVVLETLAELEGDDGNVDLAVRLTRRATDIVAAALPAEHPRQLDIRRSLLRQLDRQDADSTVEERARLRERLEQEQDSGGESTDGAEA